MSRDNLKKCYLRNTQFMLCQRSCICERVTIFFFIIKFFKTFNYSTCNMILHQNNQIMSTYLCRGSNCHWHHHDQCKHWYSDHILNYTSVTVIIVITILICNRQMVLEPLLYGERPLLHAWLKLMLWKVSPPQWGSWIFHAYVLTWFKQMIS